MNHDSLGMVVGNESEEYRYVTWEVNENSVGMLHVK